MPTSNARRRRWRAIAHRVGVHAERDASEALDPSADGQRRHEERTQATLRRNADKLRSALANTTERIGAKGKPIKRNLTDAESARSRVVEACCRAISAWRPSMASTR